MIWVIIGNPEVNLPRPVQAQWVVESWSFQFIRCSRQESNPTLYRECVCNLLLKRVPHLPYKWTLSSDCHVTSKMATFSPLCATSRLISGIYEYQCPLIWLRSPETWLDAGSCVTMSFSAGLISRHRHTSNCRTQVQRPSWFLNWLDGWHDSIVQRKNFQSIKSLDKVDGCFKLFKNKNKMHLSRTWCC